MGSIIIALPKSEDARKIGEIIGRRGYETTAICNTASAVLSKANELDHGVIICSKKLPDMYYVQLAEMLPEFFNLLLLTANPGLEEVPESVVCVKMPLRAPDLYSTLDMMLSNVRRRYKRVNSGPRLRSSDEQKTLDQAKSLLMDRNDMTEAEAFRYIQKCSMDTGTNMVEVAQMILMLDADP